MAIPYNRAPIRLSRSNPSDTPFRRYVLPMTTTATTPGPNAIPVPAFYRRGALANVTHIDVTTDGTRVLVIPNATPTIVPGPPVIMVDRSNPNAPVFITDWPDDDAPTF